MRRLMILLALLVFANTSWADPCGVSCNGGWASGTTIEGAPEGRTWVVTNRHVVMLGGKQIKQDEKIYDATLLRIHPTADLALIEVQAILPVSKLAATDPTKGTKFQLQGYGVRSGGFDLLRKGEVATCVGSGLSTAMFISPGDSGSGLITEANELIGVIWGCRGQGGGPGVGIPVSQVHALLKPPPPPAPPQRRYRF